MVSIDYTTKHIHGWSPLITQVNMNHGGEKYRYSHSRLAAAHRGWDEVYHNLESNPAYYLQYYNGAPAHNDSCGENATNYLRAQFNPLIIENVPPVLVKFTVRVEGGKLHYHILLRDAGKIESVLINDETGTGYYVNNSVNAVVFEHWGHIQYERERAGVHGEAQNRGVRHGNEQTGCGARNIRARGCDHQLCPALPLRSMAHARERRVAG